jgi:asparagine synthase (glutamine-hydrolysing)
MCGIAGIVYKDRRRTCSASLIKAMCDTMVHRGPDDQGIFLKGNVALGHRRLSIIDLDTGHQPMQSADQNYTIVFNGEIYNYLELKKDLQNSGFSFRTSSDTEVILNLYRKYGAECAVRLNGIFAFAIWDDIKKELFIARDHVGVKPLYYYSDANVLVLASEIKAILESRHVNAKCNSQLVPEYFVFRQVAGESTLFKDIYALLPGHYLVLRNNNDINITKYWDINAKKKATNLSFQDALRELSSLLEQSIEMQMMSDVPLGTFCSGGIDSSLVTAIAARKAQSSINTFSVGFNELEFDETKYARIVSKKYGTSHHELRLNNNEFSEYYQKMIWQNDLPLNYPNSVLIYAISKLAKQFVTVVLTGEGADELFGGYPRYYIPSIVARLQKIPSPLRKIAGYGFRLVKDHRVDKLRTYLGMSIDNVLMYNSATMGQNNIEQYKIDIELDNFEYRKSLISDETDQSQLDRVTYIDQMTYLISILNRQDKMSMAASIESRVPILDYRIVEFANSLPDKYRQSRTQTKLILKKLAEKYLPHEVIYRKKSGFGVPIKDWFAADTGLGEIASDLVTNKSLDELQWGGNITKIIDEHRKGVLDHSELLWTATNYVLWKETFNVSL